MDIFWQDRTSTSLMTYEQVIKDAATIAKKEGVEEGISECASLVKKEMVARMIKNGSFSESSGDGSCVNFCVQKFTKVVTGTVPTGTILLEC